MKNLALRNLSNLILIIVFLFAVYSCSIRKAMEQSNCNREKSYIEMMKIAGVEVKKIKKKNFYCENQNTYGDTSIIRQYYSDNIFFEGAVVNNMKTGIWKGYYLGKQLVKVGYCGDSENSPMFIEIFGVDGILIRSYYIY